MINAVELKSGISQSVRLKVKKNKNFDSRTMAARLSF